VRFIRRGRRYLVSKPQQLAGQTVGKSSVTQNKVLSEGVNGLVVLAGIMRLLIRAQNMKVKTFWDSSFLFVRLLFLFFFHFFVSVYFSFFCFHLFSFAFVCFCSFIFIQTRLATINVIHSSIQIASSSPHHLSTPSGPILRSRMSFAQMHRSNRTDWVDVTL
jgi:hypothetical protein